MSVLAGLGRMQSAGLVRLVRFGRTGMVYAAAAECKGKQEVMEREGGWRAWFCRWLTPGTGEEVKRKGEGKFFGEEKTNEMMWSSSSSSSLSMAAAATEI